MVQATQKPLIWLVVPCYNEEAVLPKTAPLFLTKLEALIAEKHISDKSRICFIDDGSTDQTWSIIYQLSLTNPHFIGISLSRNHGHQNALLCGLLESRKYCDAVISLDCDGQDDIDAIDAMLKNFLAGDDIVYGVRSSRETDTFFKRGSAELFYKFLNVFDAKTVYNHADYRLMSTRALDALAEYNESNLYLRGMVPLLGLPSSTVEYKRINRIAGKSHYPLTKMLGLALNGITNLSAKPIRLVSTMGIIFSLLGLAGVIWAILTALAGQSVAGWASTIVIISLIGGIQLLSLGVIGEYVGKIYIETKHRPQYLIQEKTWEANERHYQG